MYTIFVEQYVNEWDTGAMTSRWYETLKLNTTGKDDLEVENKSTKISIKRDFKENVCCEILVGTRNKK